MGTIRIYQKTFSPDHGPLKPLFPNGYCRFYPTCSEYGYQAFKKHGVMRGLWLTTKRVSRCHPWNPPRIDPVP